MESVRTICWRDDAVVVLDQGALPHERRELRLTTCDELVDAIKRLAVRGAPALGMAGALGVALSARLNSSAVRDDGGARDVGAADGGARDVDEDAVRADAARLAEARPTAVNLRWGVERALGKLHLGAAAVLAEALAMLDEDELVNRAAAATAADVLQRLCRDKPLNILTHCNTGRLAASAWGTALGAIRELWGRGALAEVLVDETRPLLQGSRLTAWELTEAGIPYRLCVDSAAAFAMARGMVDAVVVGADRVAANGDVANKIGTYALAVAAAQHGIPFVVVAPESTVDEGTPSGDTITVEERADDEVTTFGGVGVAPAGSATFNPAFDVTPHALVSAIVTERRVLTPSSAEELARTCHELYQRGWLDGTSGNLSLLLPSGQVLITPSGRGKGTLHPADLVLVGLDGHSTGNPSAETAIHLALYRARPDCGAVVHAHTPYASALACRAGRTGARTLVFRGYELIKGLTPQHPDRLELPVFANDPDLAALGADVERRISPEAPALLIADHGVTVWGPDLETARNRLECLELLCRQHLLVHE
jgi:methylthioribose-1-phosphate isomerase